MVIICVVDYFFFAQNLGIDLPYIIIAVIVSTISVIVIDLIFALIVRRFLPGRWFSADKKFYVAGRGEKKFYEKIGIKKWKDKVIELGALSGFRKNKILRPNSVEYIERYIIEANFGIVVHIADIIFGFLVLFVYPLKFWYCFGFPVAIVNAVLNLLPMFILRYNLPKLHKLYSFNKRKNNV
jgi:hypothetical protein